jgi:hypothetical protein
VYLSPFWSYMPLKSKPVHLRNTFYSFGQNSRKNRACTLNFRPFRGNPKMYSCVKYGKDSMKTVTCRARTSLWGILGYFEHNLVKNYACAPKFDPCRDITNTHACMKFGKKLIRNTACRARTWNLCGGGGGGGGHNGGKTKVSPKTRFGDTIKDHKVYFKYT